jgi:hypothetical protein
MLPLSIYPGVIYTQMDLDELLMSDFGSFDGSEDTPHLQSEDFSFLYARKKKRQYFRRPHDLESLFKMTLAGCCICFLHDKGGSALLSEIKEHVKQSFTQLRNVSGTSYKGSADKCVLGMMNNNTRIFIRTADECALGEDDDIQAFTQRLMNSLSKRMDYPKKFNLKKNKESFGRGTKAVQLSMKLCRELSDKHSLSSLLKKPFNHFKTNTIEDLCEQLGPQRFLGLVSGFAYFRNLLTEGSKISADELERIEFLRRISRIKDKCTQLDQESEALEARKELHNVV